MISNLEIGRMSNLSNTGVVVSVRGSVVDIRFDGDLPPIHSVLRAGQEERIIIEVLAQHDAHHVRGIALTPTQGLARGTRWLRDTGGPLKAPLGKELLSRMILGHYLCLACRLRQLVGFLSCLSLSISLFGKRPATRLIDYYSAIPYSTNGGSDNKTSSFN